MILRLALGREASSGTLLDVVLLLVFFRGGGLLLRYSRSELLLERRTSIGSAHQQAGRRRPLGRCTTGLRWWQRAVV